MAREVKVGDTTHTLDSLSGFKVLRAGKMLARITKQATGIADEISKFAADYRQANTEEVSRALFEFRASTEAIQVREAVKEELRERNPGWDEDRLGAESLRRAGEMPAISDEAWERSGNVVRMSRSPSPMEIGAFVLPTILDSAEDEVVRLLALLVTSDQKLRDAKRDGSYDELLDREGESLLFDGQVDELVELTATAAEVLAEKMQGKLGRLSKALGMLTGRDESEEATSGTSTNSTSLTKSPEPTDGGKTTSSSPTGTPSPASASA